MNKFKTALLLLITETFLFANPSSQVLYDSPIIQAQNIQTQVQKELLETPPYLLHNQSIINNFYEQRQYQPMWLINNGLKQEKIKNFLHYVRSDLTLNTKGYIYQEGQKLTQIFQNPMNQTIRIKLELRLTSLYYEVLQHTIYGEINWGEFTTKLNNLKEQNIEANWVQYGAHLDIIELMSRENVMNTIQEMTPKHYQYSNLLQALRKLYTIRYRGGWELLPYFKRLKVGSRNIAVAKLRKRLKISEDYKECSDYSTAQTSLFDNCLKVAVQRFQNRHGLKVDGIVGQGTRSVLNQSIEGKIHKILLNIDRIKWLPRENSERYIVVNIPEFLLHYVENQQESNTLKVIVGNKKHPTPIFSDKISNVVLNPYWKVPESIVENEVIPAMIANPNYIRNQGLEAHMTWDENSEIVPLDNINWHEYMGGEQKFPYRLMQAPSPRNALGKIKFKFPNRFSVYLHDTPTKHLFNRKVRAFSHGCIRLSQPQSLLQSLSRVDQNIEMVEAQNVLASKRKQQINVAHKIPIHLVYLTTGVNANNELIFRNDIYDYDTYQTRFIR